MSRCYFKTIQYILNSRLTLIYRHQTGAVCSDIIWADVGLAGFQSTTINCIILVRMTELSGIRFARSTGTSKFSPLSENLQSSPMEQAYRISELGSKVARSVGDGKLQTAVSSQAERQWMFCFSLETRKGGVTCNQANKKRQRNGKSGASPRFAHAITYPASLSLLYVHP
jgi:hypothetical protein